MKLHVSTGNALRTYGAVIRTRQMCYCYVTNSWYINFEVLFPTTRISTSTVTTMKITIAAAATATTTTTTATTATVTSISNSICNSFASSISMKGVNIDHGTNKQE